jgi:hypothetical protein
VTYPAGSECEPALNNQNLSARLSKFAPPAISILGALLIFALSLGTYCLHYFPYEDDFSLIRYSAAQNSPAPVTWITKGFSEYFANDPQCATRYFGFDRPVANATFYLESLLYRSAEGPFLLMTNVLCWIVSAWFVYGIARRLGASRWISSVGILLYALSPCWYRDLIHASFRNNGLTACFLLAASFVLLKEDAVRSWARLLAAGLLIALAAGSHEQGFTSLPVFVVGVAWLSFKTERRWRWGRIVFAVAAVVAPSILMLGCFRLMNPMYGTSYATAGFLDSLTQSRHLTALGIHNPLLIGTIKLTVRVFGALVSAMSAFTPLGGENLAQLSPYLGIIILALVIVASLAIVKQFPGQTLPVAALILYAVGRSFGIPSAEPRFMHMEVAWGIIALVSALSAGFASDNRAAIIAGAAAVLGLFAFNIVSYNATILMHHSNLQLRNDIDRQAFYRIEAAASKYPGAQVILINDHAGIESSRAMLELAGFNGDSLEILPTIMNSSSTDTLRDVAACPASTQLLRFPATLQIHLDYSTGCAVYFFGRDMGCMVKEYKQAGRFHSAAWAVFIQQPEKQGLYPPPLIHDVPIQPGKPLVVVAWRDRLSVPDVTVMPNENAITLDGQMTR